MMHSILVSDEGDVCSHAIYDNMNHVINVYSQVMLVLEGVAHAYVFGSAGCKKWDTAAPEAIVHAMGGKMTDIHGNMFQYHATVEKVNLAGVLATKHTKDHAWYKEKIPAHVRDALPPTRK